MKMNVIYIIVLVMYVIVKVQATRKKPWEQSETAPIIWQMEVEKGREELEY